MEHLAQMKVAVDPDAHSGNLFFQHRVKAVENFRLPLQHSGGLRPHLVGQMLPAGAHELKGPGGEIPHGLVNGALIQAGKGLRSKV